jgi:hypothetical protein
MRILLTQVRLAGVSVAVLAAALWLAACSSSASQTATATAAATTSQPTAAPATATSATAPAGATPNATPSPSPSATGAENLMLTDSIRAQLVAAAAKLNGLPASAYLGLVHGESYYGFDPATNTYWAGGALDPSPSSQRAQVSVQDDGGYYIFQKPAGGSWSASAEGLAGIEGAKCSVDIPPALVARWHWSPGACHPAGI